MSFAADTAVHQMAPGRYGAQLHDRWSSLRGVHGGYTAAVVVRAIETAVGDPDRLLRTVAVQFAASPRPGPVQIDVVIERAGRSLTTSSARLRQGDDVLVVAHAMSAPPRPGITYDEHIRPRTAEPGEAPVFVPAPPVPHFANVDIRLDPDTAPFAGQNEAVMAAWLRPLDSEPLDTAWIVAMCEVLPPAVFSRTTGPVDAASLEFVVHLGSAGLRVDPDAYVYLSSRSHYAAQGFAVEDGIMWAPDGTVLALSRQTRLAGMQ